ncbi:MAG: YdcF family protein [Verrucomicrobiota bacterium]
MVTKIIYFFAPLVEPIGFLWLINVAWAAVLLVRRKYREAWLPLTTTALIWVFGCTPLSARLLATLEKPYAKAGVDNLPACDAVVMLGGCARASQYDAQSIDLTAAVDRVTTAWRLVRQNKARALVLGGGGHRVNGIEQAEGKLLLNALGDLGFELVPAYSLGICSNTHDEARRVEPLIKEHAWRSLLLVTSAYHMKRAEATFRKLNLPITTVACDFQVVGCFNSTDRFTAFPDSEKLRQMELYLHEVIGLLIYRWRGWV